jgi:hypothetical protein
MGQLNISSYMQIMKKLEEDYLTELVLEVSFSQLMGQISNLIIYSDFTVIK